MNLQKAARLCLVILALGSLPSRTAASPLIRTPNLEPTDITSTDDLLFTLTHLFAMSGGKVVAYPTFSLSGGISDRAELQVRYASHSHVVNMANEWEPSIRYQLLNGDGPLALTASGAYNLSATSADLGLSSSYDLGPLSLHVTGKGFSSGFGVGGATAAVGAGANWQLDSSWSLAGDFGGVVASRNMQAIADQLPTLGLTPAWSVATTFRLPRSPHFLSLYATNATTRTLQGTSRGSGDSMFGFEFLMPYTP